MGWWMSRAARGGILLLLLLMAGALPGTGLLAAAPLTAPTIVAGSAADEFDELNDLAATRRARPGPAPTAAPQQLILAELNPRRAPVPLGPVTYVPILYYHYIRINPSPLDRVGLAAETPARAAWEMKQSKLTLEGLLGHPVLDLPTHTGASMPMTWRKQGASGSRRPPRPCTGARIQPASSSTCPGCGSAVACR